MEFFEVLKEIKRNKFIDKSLISKKLNVTVGEVELAMQVLEDLGYIRKVDLKCNDKLCYSCPFKGSCTKKFEVYEVIKN